MIHIVFQPADAAALKKSFDLDETLQGEIIEIKDDHAVGPIPDIFSEAGIEVRKHWWREVLPVGCNELQELPIVIIIFMLLQFFTSFQCSYTFIFSS